MDGAEDYLPFSYEGLGPWITYDGDGGYTQTINSVSYLNWNDPKAYIVMNPKEAGLNKIRGGNGFLPHSGNNYFAAWWTASTTSGSYRMPNNDWLISPEVNPLPHEISFWARGVEGTEQMQVLATDKEYNSASDMNAEDWTVLKEAFQVGNSEWKEYKVQVPQEMKHIALQCCSQSGSGLFLDDIAYEVPLKELTGYRVYRNGQLVSLLSSNATSYVDPTPPANAYYYVTAIYDTEGESSPSNIFGQEPEVEPDPEPEENPADVNGDGVVDVSDIAQIIDFMSMGFYDKYADVNRDGVVDVADVAEVIDAMAGN